MKNQTFEIWSQSAQHLFLPTHSIERERETEREKERGRELLIRNMFLVQETISQVCRTICECFILFFSTTSKLRVYAILKCQLAKEITCTRFILHVYCLLSSMCTKCHLFLLSDVCEDINKEIKKLNCGLEDREVEFRVTCPYCSNRLWDPLSLLSVWYRGSFLRG
jgi:hypothetical protein